MDILSHFSFPSPKVRFIAFILDFTTQSGLSGLYIITYRCITLSS